MEKNLSAEQINGSYEIVGKLMNEEAVPYLGILKLNYIADLNRVEAQWLIEDKYKHYGYGFVNHRDIFINFSYIDQGEVFYGIVVYQFEEPDLLIGKWTEENDTNIGMERGRRILK